MRKRTRWARPVLVAYPAALLAALPVAPGEAAGRSASWCGTSPWGALSSVWAHFETAQRFGSALPAAALASGAASDDVGEIAVIQDNGDLMLPRNLLDLEGNDIQDLGGGQFRTTATAERYGPGDQYFMGLRKPEEVPPFFFVRNPSGTSSLEPGRWPEAGVAFGGTRRDVPFGDVLTAMGRREPAAGAKTEPWRQAFVFVTNGPADSAFLGKVERLRAAWGPYFARSTEGRWAVDTRLAVRRPR